MEPPLATTTTPSSVDPSVQQAASLSPERALKRKFEDAIHVLDDAVRPTVSVETVQPPSKRPRPSGTTRSLYATLAKYGIKKDAKPAAQESRLQSLSKSAPHLVALLSRSATHARKINPFKLSASPSASIKSGNVMSDYRPSSTASFLARLATYKLTTYANKPSAIDAVAAAKCGWVNEGKDRLLCGMCNVSWILASKEGLNRDAANSLVEKQRVQLVEMHKDGCPWKTRQCDASIYRVPLQTPSSMVKDLKAQAIKLDAVMQGIQIKHPLTAAQAQTLQLTMSSVRLQGTVSMSEDEHEASAATESISTFAFAAAPLLAPEPSAVSVLTALFGWSIMPPSIPEERPRSSASRSASVAPSTPGTPRISRRLSSRSSTPAPSTTPRISSISLHAASSNFSSIPPSTASNTTLLHCSLCQRRIGLWAFLPTQSKEQRTSESPTAPAPQSDSSLLRQFDVLKEHRSYCPYVVRSTTVPSLPVQPLSSGTSSPSISNSNLSLAQLNGSAGEVEGWRAVLSVVLRYGATQKQRLGYSRSMSTGRPLTEPGISGCEASESGQEVDPVAAMVEGVKARGGRDLLKYVKGLLG